MDQQTGLAIADRWIAAWNRHDLEEILSHYAEAIDFTSPLIPRLLGNSDGRIQGKAALRAYFAKGLAAYPDLHFKPIQVLVGVNSVVIYYHTIRELLSAEFMVIDSEGLITHVSAHYNE